MKKDIVLILFVIILVIIINNAEAEFIPSISIDSLYYTDSEAFAGRCRGDILNIADTMIVDVDEEAVSVYKSGVIDGYFYFPVVPDNLKYLIITDGLHFVSGHFVVVSSEVVYAYFWIEEICALDRLTNLNLLLLT